MLRHVDLCSGIGGFALGFEQAGLSHPVMFCDIEPWSRQVLAKHWPDVPIAEDVKELSNDPGNLVPDCDILTAGYPCQPFSLAGKQRGAEDDRHIWPYIRRIVAFKRPTWCVFENVYGHVALGLDQVLADLEAEGYASRTFIVPACGVEAPHRRDRLWIIAHTDSESEPDVSGHGGEGQRLGASNVGNSDSSQCCWDIEATEQGGRQQGLAAGCEDVADTDSKRGCSRDAKRQDAGDAGKSPGCQGYDTRGMETRQPQSSMGGMAYGLSTRMDGFNGFEREPEDIPRVSTGIKGRTNRLRGLGNAIVPQIAERIGLTIKQMEQS